MLEKIPDVGAKKAKILLAAFPNFNDIRVASVEELAAIEGIDKRAARSVYEYFVSKTDEN